MAQFFVDYYAILEISPTATREGIRHAYRRLAKRWHPDKNPGNERAARVRFEQVLRAYETLSDDRKRLFYDHTEYAQRPTAETLRENRCLQVLELLLSERSAEALIHFDAFLMEVRRTVFDVNLPEYLDYNDARDCEFLLAEAFEIAHRDGEAIAFYEQALARERRRPYFRAFTQEILLRLKNLYLSQLRSLRGDTLTTSVVESVMEKIIRLGGTKREHAHTYKRLAELLATANQPDMARDALGTALTLFPNLPGVKRLANRVGMSFVQVPT